MQTGTVHFITRANFQHFFFKKVFSRNSFSWLKKEHLSGAIDRGKTVIFKNYLADLPASYSTRTGAIVFVAIDRRTRIVSFRQ
jgi:hypothetical protein